METEQELQHPHSHLFTLRIWEEALGEGNTEWRGRLQEIVTGDTVFFRDWPGLVTTLKRLTSKPARVPEGQLGGVHRAEDEDS
jgi:hypothetical protein